MTEKHCEDCKTVIQVPFGVLVNVELDMRNRGDPDGLAVYVCSECEAAMHEAEEG